jgi:hypothetical protein
MVQVSPVSDYADGLELGEARYRLRRNLQEGGGAVMFRILLIFRRRQRREVERGEGSRRREGNKLI